MAQPHSSTPDQRAQWVAQLLAQQGTYGVVAALARRVGVARQTLHVWRRQGQAALCALFQPAPSPSGAAPALERAVLSLLVRGHATYRGIQDCLPLLGYPPVSLGRIAAIIGAAQQRALAWFAQPRPVTVPTLGLDEIYGNDRRGAYLSVVDPRSGVVWAAEGPLAVDSDSWTLLLWQIEERGLRWQTAISDGGAAITAACRGERPAQPQRRDVWHVLHRVSQVQGRLDRQVQVLVAQTATVARQAARIAAGQRPRGRSPQTDGAAHAQRVRAAQQVAAGLRYLGQELRSLLAVVVLRQEQVLDAVTRRQEVAAVVELLGDLAASAPASMSAELQQLQQHVAAAQAGLLAFADDLDGVQRVVSRRLGAAAVGLIGWAWQHRRAAGWTAEQIVAGLLPAWRGGARWLLRAWAGAVRASSLVEMWHSLLRPHLAVHRTLSNGLLALLAVWHNHRVYSRGEHAGQSPLQLSGVTPTAIDWLTALGYPPAALASASCPPAAEVVPLAA